MTVFVFGVFDGFHEGHKYFLREAARFGDRLIVSVTRDELVNQLKNRAPRYSLKERMEKIRQSGYANEVIEGDAEINTWNGINKYKPEILAFGYDQEKIMNSFKNIRDQFPFVKKYVIISAFKPDSQKSTLLYH